MANAGVDGAFSSYLPERIIRHILSFLPSCRDMVMASLISKQWNRASFPILSFSGFGNWAPGYIRDSPEDMISVGDKTISGFHRRNLKIVKVEIRNWCIRFVLDNKVEEMSINNEWLSYLRFKPNGTFSALQSLKLVGVELVSCGASVNLKLLQSLTFEHVSMANDNFWSLMISCRSLEFLCIKYCEFRGYHYNLSSFTEQIREVNENHSLILKSLTLESLDNTNFWFEKLLSGLPLLEELDIKQCDSLKSIRIRNPGLKRIDIIHCKDLAIINLVTPELEQFRLDTTMAILDKRCALSSGCVANVSLSTKSIPYWDKLRKFTSRFRVFNDLKLEIQLVDDLYDVRLRLCGVEKIGSKDQWMNFVVSHIRNQP